MQKKDKSIICHNYYPNTYQHTMTETTSNTMIQRNNVPEFQEIAQSNNKSKSYELYIRIFFLVSLTFLFVFNQVFLKDRYATVHYAISLGICFTLCIIIFVDKTLRDRYKVSQLLRAIIAITASLLVFLTSLY